MMFPGMAIVAVPVGCCLFVLMLRLTKVLSDKDIRLIKAVFQGNRGIKRWPRLPNGQ